MMGEITLVADELINEFRRMYPREFEIGVLTVTNRKLRERVGEMEKVLESSTTPSEGEGGGTFWAGTEKKVPLRAEKD